MRSTRREFLRTSAAAGFGLAVSRDLLAFERSAPKKILILGGTGFLGPHFVECAVKRGHTMTLFNRGKTHPTLFPDLEKLRGDRDTGDLESLKGRKWDAVVDTSAYFPRVVRQATDVLKDNVGQYVFISTVSVYGDPAKIGIDENSPVAKIDDATTEKVTGESYGALKALCEQAAEAGMPGKVATIRPGLIVGPGDESDRFTYWPVRVDRGGEVLAPGTPTDPVQFIDARDLAEWMVRVIEQGTFGVYNAVGPKEPLPMKKLLDACNENSGGKATFVWADTKFLAEQKVSPFGDMPVWVPPGGEEGGLNRVSNKRALDKGLAFRDERAIAKDTLDWYKQELPQRRERAKASSRPFREMRAGISADREAAVLKAWHATHPAK